LVEVAQSESESHNWVAVFHHCERALALTDQPSAATYSLKGDALVKLGSFALALNAFESAVLADPLDAYSGMHAKRLAKLLAPDAQTDQTHNKLPTDKIINVDVFLCEGQISLQLKQVPASIAGLVWNSSIVLAAILEERFLHAGTKPSRILELGCGLAVTGMAAQRLFSESSCTLSDYDHHVLKTVKESVELNEPWGNEPAVSVLDFRDVEAAQAMVDQSGSFDLLIGADVVYDFSVLKLPKLVKYLLRKEEIISTSNDDLNADESLSSPPIAMFLSPVGRPRMNDFIAAATDCGLAVNCDTVISFPMAGTYYISLLMMRHIPH
jgi:predicted nicotinamide N-methyase